jgi:hypothetical protein
VVSFGKRGGIKNLLADSYELQLRLVVRQFEGREACLRLPHSEIKRHIFNRIEGLHHSVIAELALRDSLSGLVTQHSGVLDTLSGLSALHSLECSGPEMIIASPEKNP